ncbi:C-terminal binding protein [Falsiroseomonas selenitidurans]|uniref:C-terminal binding protein n=1 Tax=Falsiroseomonas selenitidurans TaxID=2716335 RepID=A0ABX1E2U4_9PROT|nr:C-terminal binding protein [Falsiroseomonas selenitidurans]NKC30087.1 C-terminal binding protein [Falsiroseomonas selenitidurans]
MTRPRLLVIDPQGEDEDIERAIVGEEAELVFRRSVGGRLPDAADYATADAVLNCRSMHLLGADVIARFTRCRVIVQGGVGFAHIDLAAAGARGIPVLTTPDYGTTEVADHAVALALGLLRGVQGYDRRLRRGNAAWDARQMKQVRRLGTLRVGILGLGRIGTAAALRFQAFGMKVGFHDPHLPVGHQLAFGWERFPTAEALLARSDVLSLHAPLNEATAGLLDARRLALLPPGAVLVNTARGGLVDLDALGEALRSGHLAGAGLDVFEAEPLDRAHPLLAAWAAGAEWLDDRLTLTPHAAFFSSASIRDIRRLSMQYMMDYLRHGARPTCVNAAFLKP